MKTCQWRRVVENRCVFSAHLKALSDRSGDCSAGGRGFHVAGLLTAKLRFSVAVQAHRTSRGQSLQIADADVLILCGEYCRKSDQSTSEVKYLVDCVHDSDDNSSLSHSRCTLRFGVLVQVGVKITLGSSSLTKIVTFTPYYVLINQAKVGCFSHYNSEHNCT